MNKKLLIILPVLMIIAFTANSQITWTQKANFGGGNITEARAFSIGNYGYFGGPTAVLWRYDPVADVWSQMAAFPGTTRLSPVAFSIGTKGYLGTGGNFNDFYEYDAVANSWTPKASFGGSGREGALGIAIDGKGYVGTGGNYLNDWWEFDPTVNAWTQKANLAAPGRYHGGAFTIGSKGYVCTGFNGTFMNDLLEYDPVSNAWTVKASMPAVTRDRPVGIGTATKGYIITGWTGSVALNDAWEYDPFADTWTQLPAMPTAGRYNSCGFSIGNKLYIGTGYMNQTVSDFWSYGSDCISQVSEQAATCGGVCDGQASVVTPDPAAISSYLWSDGQITAIATNLCAGTYSVSVTDTSGCTSITSFTITEPDPITVAAGMIQPTCFGDSDGELCALPSVTPVTFLWAGGDTSACIQNIPGGIYTLTVTDSSGCSATVPLTLLEPGEITVNFNPVDASCSTCPNGSASAQISGGTPPLTYLWSTGSTLAFINNLLPGVYSICVTDANNCVSCDSVEIEFSVGLTEAGFPEVIVSPNPFTDYISIDAELSSENYNIRLYDISGRELVTENNFIANKKQLNTSGIQKGVYFLEISSADMKRVLKMVKN